MVHLQSTIMIILTCVISVSGAGELRYDTEAEGFYVQTKCLPGFALPGMAFVCEGSPRRALRHELGHSSQVEKYGIAYLPLAAISSGIGNLSTLLGFGTDYYALQTEHEAQVLGRNTPPSQ